ncbi:uncharacterized protein PHALS_11649 [Plasmopara halstedii]|uniref:Uncharacterized protein n=1 Tax=Plasmopara halstedii TaxID=4781 RepID=A0A0P1AJC5_PLAHL|nr:uncharacterized protein PHALS_11649 [Plasmopara halstedii]CEG41292.1 hypothetical protein PHALS_11649 [Plasmopara halstedii]|eukprot:XP_024577661.1 hypothetical protein PHALS_11649 [Plasmopara halstedii]
MRFRAHGGNKHMKDRQNKQSENKRWKVEQLEELSLCGEMRSTWLSNDRNTAAVRL